MAVAAMLAGMFFRPEEYRIASEGIDNAGVLQLLEVNALDEDERLKIVLDAEAHILVQIEDDRCVAAQTRAFDMHGDWCVRVVPLHEGHGKGIDRSGREGVLTGIEVDSMPRVFACHGVRPGHGVGLCAIQERQIPLQVFDQLRGSGQVQAE